MPVEETVGREVSNSSSAMAREGQRAERLSADEGAPPAEEEKPFVSSRCEHLEGKTGDKEGMVTRLTLRF